MGRHGDRPGRLAHWLLSTALLLGCGDSESEPVTTTSTGGAGGSGGTPTTGGGEGGCPPGELYDDADDSCLPAGIPEEACAEGFEPDGQRGCAAILPDEPCAAGLMAIPGDGACRQIAPCGDGTWGDIPVESTTEYVDRGYGGGGNDGSETHPWTTISQGLEAAEPGAIVAIAAGSYGEALDVTKPVRLWGRCPSLVEIVSVDPNAPTVVVRAGADAAEIHDLAIGEGPVPLAISGALEVVVERTWIHSGTVRGIEVSPTFGPASIILRGSLIENNHGAGLLLGGTVGTVEDSVIRDTLPNLSDLRRGRAIVAQHNPGAQVPAELTLRGSLLERNHQEAITVLASNATVEATLVRDTLPEAIDDRAGRGINIVDDFPYLTGMRSVVTIRSSVVEGNRDLGIGVFGSTATVEHTVVRDTLPELSTGFAGRGLGAQVDVDTGATSELTVRSSVVAANREVGLFAAAADLLVEATVVRETAAVELRGGRAIQAQSYLDLPTTITVRGSLLEDNTEGSVMVTNRSTAVLEGVLVRNTGPRPWDDRMGDGILGVAINGAQPRVELSYCRVEGSYRSAVSSWGGVILLQATSLECNAIDLNAEVYLDVEPDIQNLGGNHCACDADAKDCQVLSANLIPPEPLPPANQ